MKYQIYCIIQPGELEVQALLLLCSLKKNLLGGCVISAFIPEHSLDDAKLQASTIDLLKKLDVPLIKFTNTFINQAPEIREGDLFSNKYFPLPQLCGADYCVFIDSDMLLSRELVLKTEIFGADFFAKPVCFMNEHRWKELYRLFDLEVPLHKIRGTVDQKEGPPYFNGGLFVIKSNLVNKFHYTWIDTFNKITNSSIMDDNLNNREQVALAMTITRLEMNYHLLTEKHNFPARSKQIGKHSNPYLVHYHDPESIFKNQDILALVRDLFNEYPELSGLANRLKNWKIITEHSASPFQIFNRIKYKLKGYYQSRKIK